MIGLSKSIKHGALSPAPTSGSPRLLISEIEKTASIFVPPTPGPWQSKGDLGVGTTFLLRGGRVLQSSIHGCKRLPCKFRWCLHQASYRSQLWAASWVPAGGLFAGPAVWTQLLASGGDWEEVFHFELTLWNDMFSFSWDSRHFLISTCPY